MADIFVIRRIISTLGIIIVSYLLGSISSSIIITRRVSNKADIRSMGSGNAGLTNVLRSVGAFAGVLTLIGDFLKGILALWITQSIFLSPAFIGPVPYAVFQLGSYLAGTFCLLGHIYPCFFGFKGGKGILTASAVILMIDWRIFCIVIGAFVIVLFCSKIVSLASLTAAVLFPIATFCVGFFADYHPSANTDNGVSLSYLMLISVISLAIAALVIYKHRANIERLLNGTESKLSFKRRGDAGKHP